MRALFLSLSLSGAGTHTATSVPLISVPSSSAASQRIVICPLCSSASTAREHEGAQRTRAPFGHRSLRACSCACRAQRRPRLCCCVSVAPELKTLAQNAPSVTCTKGEVSSEIGESLSRRTSSILTPSASTPVRFERNCEGASCRVSALLPSRGTSSEWCAPSPLPRARHPWCASLPSSPSASLWRTRQHSVKVYLRQFLIPELAIACASRTSSEGCSRSTAFLVKTQEKCDTRLDVAMTVSQLAGRL